jgi:O-antigen ligase
MLSVATRYSLAGFRTTLERHGLVPKLFIAAMCLVYLLHNIWAARVIYDFFVLPFALLTFSFSEVKAVARTPIFMGIAAYFLLLIALAMWNHDPDMLVAKHAGYSLLVLSFVAITALQARRDPCFPTLCMLAISISAAVAAAMNMVAFYQQFPLDAIWTRRLEGIPGLTMYYNSNVVGDMYALAYAGAAGIAAGGRLSRFRLVLAASAAAVLFVAVLLSGSRGALLGSLLASAVLLVLCANTRRCILMLLAAGGLLLMLSTTPLLHSLFERADSLRLTLWPVYLNLASERLWLGYGLSFDTTITLANGFDILNAHNIILSALIRGGLLAAAALIAVLAASIYEAWRAWRMNHAPLALALLSTTLVMTNVDYEITASPLGWPWILLWLPVAISLGTGRLAAVPKEDAGTVSVRTASPTLAVR